MKKGFLLLFKICAFVISPILVKSQVAENFYIPNDSVNVIINKESLQPFFDKLKLLKTESKKVNILHLGDSHIQMGYFVEEMRNQFSKTFGLSGIGTIFPYHIAKYRPFYVSSRVISGNWEGKNHLNKEDDYKYGLCGFTLKTVDKKASFELTSLRNNNQIQTGNQCVIYYEL